MLPFRQTQNHWLPANPVFRHLSLCCQNTFTVQLWFLLVCEFPQWGSFLSHRKILVMIEASIWIQYEKSGWYPILLNISCSYATPTVLVREPECSIFLKCNFVNVLHDNGWVFYQLAAGDPTFSNCITTIAFHFSFLFLKSEFLESTRFSLPQALI